MSGVNVESKGGRRTLDSEINMVPMIDLLMCLICFLLITAVWSTMSRLEARTDVPGEPGEPPIEASAPVLHVSVDGDDRFQLTWRKGGAVLSTREVPMKELKLGEGTQAQTTYPELARAIHEEWHATGSHRDDGDRRLDQAVVHCDDRTPYSRLVAVIDSVYRTKRHFPGGGAQTYPAMTVAFARN